MRYAIVIENAGGNYSAYVPDLPRCIATGDTLVPRSRRIRGVVEDRASLGRVASGRIDPPSVKPCRVR